MSSWPLKLTSGFSGQAPNIVRTTPFCYPESKTKADDYLCAILDSFDVPQKPPKKRQAPSRSGPLTLLCSLRTRWTVNRPGPRNISGRRLNEIRIEAIMNMLLSKVTRLLNIRLLIRVSHGAILVGYYCFYLCRMKMRGMAAKFLEHFRLTEQDACVLLFVHGRQALQLRVEDKPVTAARPASKVRRHPGLWCPYGPTLIGVHPHFME